VGVGRCGEGSLQQWCGFNTSVLAREGRLQDKALSKDEAETVSSSCLNRKEV
jgi:hypothetical protein